MTVTTSIIKAIIQEVSRPVSEDHTRNLSTWLENECGECETRRKWSGLKRRLEAVKDCR